MGTWGALYHLPRALSKGTVCKHDQENQEGGGLVRSPAKNAIVCVPEPGIVSPPFLAPPLGLTGCYLPLSSIFGFFAR